MAHRSRPFEGEADLLRMTVLVGEAARAVGPVGQMHMGDVLWRRYMLEGPIVDPTRNVRLWEEGNDLLGFAWFSPPEYLETQLRPGAGQEILAEMLDWGERRALEAAAEAARSPALVTDAYEAERDKVEVLLARGYRREEDYFILNAQSLDQDLPPPNLPAGAAVRPVDAEKELAERVALHREVWHPSRVTETAYRQLRVAPGYRPDLDLVAVAPDGTLAAYCICWYDQISRSGEFEPVGTREAYRRQGYGRAVVREGLRRLRALGAETAIVFSLGAVEPANRLYAACGFRELARTHDYRKRL